MSRVDDYFVFAGKIYKRPSRSVGWDMAWPDAWKASGVLLASAGLVGLALIAYEFLPSTTFFGSTGIPKWLSGESDQDKTKKRRRRKAEEESLKGKEEKLSKVSLAGQLKSLSAAMSADRANQPQTETCLPSSSSGFPATLESTIALASRLLKDPALQYCYQVNKSLESLLSELALFQTPSKALSELDMDGVRSAGQQVSTLLRVADRRSPIPRHLSREFCVLHEMLLSLNELHLENNLIPIIASQVGNCVKTALAAARNDLRQSLEHVGKDIQASLELKPSQMIHRLVSVSVALNSIESSHPEILRARELMASLSAIADELMATKVLIRVVSSIREIDHLVEGEQYSNVVFNLRYACIKFWPKALFDASGAFSPSSSSSSSDSLSPPLSVLLSLHILVRKEQFRRNALPSASTSVHDIAIWKHLVNASEEISSLAFSSPGDLQLGPTVTNFLERLNELVSFVTERNLLLGREAVSSNESMSFDNLIMDPRFTDRKTSVTDISSLTLLGTITSIKPHDTESLGVFRAIHAHLAKIVESVLPGALTGLSVGSSIGGQVTASCGTPEESDVVVCYILGAQPGTCKQLTFVRSSAPTASIDALFRQLENVELSSVLQRTVPLLNEEQRAVLAQHDELLRRFAQLSFFATAELPTAVRDKLATASSVDGLDKTQLRSLLGLEFKLPDPETLSVVVDPLLLRIDPNANVRYMRTFLASHCNAVICFLLPDIVAVAAASKAQAFTIANILSKYNS